MVDFKDVDRLIEWLMNVELIASHYVCPECGIRMRKVKNTRLQKKYMWGCTKGGYKIQRSLRTNN